MKGRGLVFGLNYADTPAALRGCINDANTMGQFVRDKIGIPCEVFTDGDDDNGKTYTTALGFTCKLHELAIKTFTEDLEFVYIHYSGHGDTVPDRSQDEADGRDEVLVPSDFGAQGVMVTDDIVFETIQQMNPKTKVVFVFDCCHSGTMTDLQYVWTSTGQARIDRRGKPTKSNVLTLSACTDDQVALDAYNIGNDHMFRGALTTCMTTVLDKDPALCSDVFALMRAIESALKEFGFAQTTTLTSSYDLTRDKTFLPNLQSTTNT